MSIETYDQEILDDESVADQLEFVWSTEDEVEPQKFHSNCQYKVLQLDQITRVMNEKIEEVQNIVDLNPTIVRLLLDYFKWSKEKFLEKFLDTNVDILFVEAKVPIDLLLTFELLNLQTGTCEICFDETDLVEYGCGHFHCHTCWRNYVTNKIESERQCNIVCPTKDCVTLFDDATIMTFIEDDKVRLQYDHNRADGFVASSKNMCWCPEPNCGRVIQAEDLLHQPVECHCGAVFCFKCGGVWHDPIDCELVKEWRAVSGQDTRSNMWIATNTKKCPKCDVNIEKNGGCNHMTCHNCRHEFCWLCLENWSGHSYNCSRYETNNSAAKTEELIKRLEFFGNRFVNQEASMKLEAQLAKNMGVRFTTDEILRKAVRTLRECRETLMHAYVFAFFHDQNNQLEIFLSNQRDLENATETLSEYLESRDILDKNLIRDKYTYCENRRKILIEHVQEGYDQDWWNKLRF